MRYRYRPEILDELSRHGVRPTAETRPELVHEFVSDLYRFELRKLRDRLRRRELAKTAYAGHVLALRERYRIISLRPEQWLA